MKDKKLLTFIYTLKNKSNALTILLVDTLEEINQSNREGLPTDDLEVKYENLIEHLEKKKIDPKEFNEAFSNVCKESGYKSYQIKKALEEVSGKNDNENLFHY